MILLNNLVKEHLTGYLHAQRLFEFTLKIVWLVILFGKSSYLLFQSVHLVFIRKVQITTCSVAVSEFIFII